MFNSRLVLIVASCSAISACTGVDNVVDNGKADDPDGEECLSTRAIYGKDNRAELFEAPDRLRDLAAGSAIALVEASAIRVESDNHIFIEAFSLGKELNLCESQRFRSQPKGAFCSGILIDDDLLLTAGHCVRSQKQCDSTRFLFNYHYQGPGQLAAMNRLDLFSCRKLLTQELSLADQPDLLDYAIVQLDRPATPRHTVANVALGELDLRDGDGLTLIGFPGGIPAKVDDNGKAKKVDRADYFTATLDAFAGSSGSGVLNEDHDVVGVLVRGEQDYVEECGCRVAKVSSSEAEGEHVTIVGRAVTALCETDWPSQQLCDRAAECGDDICTGIEDYSSCPTDCPEPICGDSVCGEHEAVTCQADCANSDSDAPPEWTCNESFYDAGDGCDCSCGAPDPDCSDTSVGLHGCQIAATWCDDLGECIAPEAPSDWTCATSDYGDGAQCDCDCGTWDPDCYDLDIPSSCGQGAVCDAETVQCLEQDSQWTCEAEYYDAADGCDCNCGEWDPDCADPDEEVFGCDDPEQTCSVLGLCE